MDLAKIHEDPSRACSLHELRRGRLELGRLDCWILWDRELKKKKLYRKELLHRDTLSQIANL